MIDRELLIHLERTFCEDFTLREERPWGLLWYNPANPVSHDSNHALILRRDAALPAVVDEIVRFYQSLAIVPRLYAAFVPGEREWLLPYLEAQGFALRTDTPHWFVWDASRCRPRSSTAEVEIRRVRAMDDDLRALIHSEGPQPWSEGVLARHVACDDFHWLVGYVAGKPVTMASLKLMPGASRVDDVQTHLAHRGHGYARALLRALVAYHTARSSQPLYLYAENPVAIRIYEEVGFVERKLDLDFWSAWKE